MTILLRYFLVFPLREIVMTFGMQSRLVCLSLLVLYHSDLGSFHVLQSQVTVSLMSWKDDTGSSDIFIVHRDLAFLLLKNPQECNLLNVVEMNPCCDDDQDMEYLMRVEPDVKLSREAPLRKSRGIDYCSDDIVDSKGKHGPVRDVHILFGEEVVVKNRKSSRKTKDEVDHGSDCSELTGAKLLHQRYDCNGQADQGYDCQVDSLGSDVSVEGVVRPGDQRSC